MGFRVILYICSLISLVYGAGELLILNSPDSLRWKGNPSLDESLLKEVYSASMGYTIEKNSNWNGMYIQDPFNYPEALVHVAIEGVTNLGKYSPLDVPKYPLNTDEDEYSTWRAMKHRVINRHPEDNNTLVRVELSGGLQELNKYPEILNDISIELSYPSSEELQVDIEENRKFFEEIAVMNAISEQMTLKKDHIHDKNQDIFWIVFTSLHAVSDFHGPDSRATAQAREILIDSLQKLTHNMNEAYNGRVLVTAVTSDASHTRRARALLADDTAAAVPAASAATTESVKVTPPTVNVNPQDTIIPEYPENVPTPDSINKPEAISSPFISTRNELIGTTESFSTPLVYSTVESSEMDDSLEYAHEEFVPEDITPPKKIELTSPTVTTGHIEDNVPVNTKVTENGEDYPATTTTKPPKIIERSRRIKVPKNIYFRAESSEVSKWNLAADYNENYPVIFNIILWFGVAFFFSLLAICYVFATMDPGRDSIIYRMTSNRMKKEN